MRRRSAAALSVAMVAGVAAGPVEYGASIHAADPCGDGGVLVGFGPTTIGPYDASATDLAAFDAVQVRGEDGESVGLDLVVEVCGQAVAGGEQERTVTVQWWTTEEQDCYVSLDLQSNFYFLLGADGLTHQSMTYGCSTGLPESVPQLVQGLKVEELDKVTIPVEVTTDGSRYLVSLRYDDLGELAGTVAPGETLWHIDVVGSTRYASYDRLSVGHLTLEED